MWIVVVVSNLPQPAHDHSTKILEDILKGGITPHTAYD
jgi:hypothetical protein